MHDKKYLVKVSKGGTYVGTLPYVIDDYQFTHDINAAGCEITVKMGTDLKSAGIITDVDYLVTQNGSHITDQSGNRIITRKDYLFTSVPMDIGNGIDIWLYYSGNNNQGQRIFSGIVTAWEEDSDNASVTMTALSWGVQLDNYPIEVLPGSKVVNQAFYNTADSLYAGDGSDGAGHIVIAGQSFQVVATTDVSAISLVVQRDETIPFNFWLGVQLWQGLLTDSTKTRIGAQAGRYISNITPQMITFTFPTPIHLVAGTTYSFNTYLSSTDRDITHRVFIHRNSTSLYTSGTAYQYVGGATYLNAAAVAGDYAFNLITSTGSIGNVFNSYDPGSIIVSLLDSFTNAGGVVDCDETSVSATGTIVSYTFKYSTVLDGIKKCLELAPPNWYWYVDVGTNVLHFHRYTLDADHTLIKGQHYQHRKVKYTIEGMKNRAIFTGGENPATPGVNVISKAANTASVTKYGQWLDFESDTRVTRQDTADLITGNILGEFAKPQFSVTCRVLAGKYDIETINIGNMVTFRNDNDLVNSLILQVVSRTKTPDYVDLTLATLPPSQTHRIEDIKRNLDNVITANNPAQ